MSWSDIFWVISGTLVPIGLFIYSFFATFKTGRLIDYNLSVMRRNTRSTFLLRYQERLLKKKWIYLNTKICGVVGMLMALLFLFAIIHALTNLKSPIN